MKLRLSSNRLHLGARPVAEPSDEGWGQKSDHVATRTKLQGFVKTLVVSSLAKQPGVAPRKEKLSGHFGIVPDRESTAPAPPLCDISIGMGRR